MSVDLGRLLRPRRVAVVGASSREGRPNTAIWRRMAEWGDEVGAEVVPVNPRVDEVDGRRCFPDLVAASAATDGPLDLVVVLTGDPVPAVAQAAECGAAFAVVFASGFAELSSRWERIDFARSRIGFGKPARRATWMP